MNNDINKQKETTEQPQTAVKKGNPIMKWFRNAGCGLLLLIILATGGYLYWKYYSVFGEGVKSGTLNYVVLKGDIFKTYEGKLIMEGVAQVFFLSLTVLSTILLTKSKRQCRSTSSPAFIQ